MGVLVLGGGTIGASVALSVSKLGRPVYLGLRDAVERERILETRRIGRGGAHFSAPVPETLALADVTSVEAMQAALTQCTTVVVCVPSTEVVEATKALAQAADQMPSMVPDSVPHLQGALNTDGTLATAAPTPAVKFASTLPVVVLSRGLLANGRTPCGALREAYPHLTSLVAAMGPPASASWWSASRAIPFGTKAEDLRYGFTEGSNPAVRVLPRLRLGASASTAMRARDSIHQVFAPLHDLSWSPCPDAAGALEVRAAKSTKAVLAELAGKTRRAKVTALETVDAATMVELTSACLSAVAVGAGLLSAACGSDATASTNYMATAHAAVARVLARASGEGQGAFALSPDTMAAVASACFDVASREYALGRDLVRTGSATTALQQQFGSTSPHAAAIQANLAALQALDGSDGGSLFAGLHLTVLGGLPAAKVGRLLARADLSWVEEFPQVGPPSAMEVAMDELHTCVVDNDGQDFRAVGDRVAATMRRAGMVSMESLQQRSSTLREEGADADTPA